jgi:carbonic anhydrase/acetyltransferase-like protein (isoleucine patch superfamily)
MKKYILTILLTLGLLIVSIPTTVSAVQFVDNNKNDLVLTDTTKRYENLMNLGTNADIKVPIFKDLYLAASNINIESNIERSAFLTGATINIKNTTIGAGTKIFGSNVTLENVKVAEDLFIAAGSVTIKNSTISGDALISTGTLEMTGSTVAKNMYYSGPKNDTLKPQVLGDLKLDVKDAAMAKAEENKTTLQSAINSFGLAQFFSGLLVLAVSIFVLNKYKKLNDSTIGFGENGKSLKHLLYGLVLSLVIPGSIIVVLASLGLLAPIGLTVFSLVILLMIIISPLTSWYIANFIFGERTNWWQPLVIFVGLSILSIIPVVGTLVGLIIGVFTLMTIGYYALKMYNLVLNELKSESKLVSIK